MLRPDEKRARMPALDEKQRAKAVALYRQGFDANTLAARFCVSQSYMIRILKAEGVATGPRGKAWA